MSRPVGLAFSVVVVISFSLSSWGGGVDQASSGSVRPRGPVISRLDGLADHVRLSDP